ncbi:hypothetical protein BJV74DRAFT_32990 [Russula compacta]|nr:hypothetical protein BJV74DRAFT_32990 [Russula compacta]
MLLVWSRVVSVVLYPTSPLLTGYMLGVPASLGFAWLEPCLVCQFFFPRVLHHHFHIVKGVFRGACLLVLRFFGGPSHFRGFTFYCVVGILSRFSLPTCRFFFPRGASAFLLNFLYFSSFGGDVWAAKPAKPGMAVWGPWCTGSSNQPWPHVVGKQLLVVVAVQGRPGPSLMTNGSVTC